MQCRTFTLLLSIVYAQAWVFLVNASTIFHFYEWCLILQSIDRGIYIRNLMQCICIQYQTTTLQINKNVKSKYSTVEKPNITKNFKTRHFEPNSLIKLGHCNSI